MDRLVKPDQKEVEMVFKRNQKCTATLRLTNLMHTMSVAVSLTTTNPSLFSFTQFFSIIPPLSSASYTLLLSHPSDQPPSTTPPVSITVRSSMLPTGRAHQDDLRRLFSKPGPHVFKDASIPISLVGPHVAEFLISHHTQIPDIEFVLNKAISGCNNSQLTALLKSAVVSGSAKLVSSLIDAGGDVNDKDPDGKSMISQAVRAGDIEIVKVLIASGCEIDNSLDRVLYDAAEINRADLIEILFAGFADIDVNSVDSDGRTPIHIAAIHGHAEVIRFLVSVGGDPDAVDCNGWSPLHCAANDGHFETVECLLDCSIYSKYTVNKDRKTAFALAVENDHSDLYDLLQLGDILHRAARVDDFHGMKNSLAEGARVSGRDQNGWTPLHRAAFKGNVGSVKVLLSHGAPVDVVDDAGRTPLHCAVEAGRVQVALLLIAHGARANVKSLKSVSVVPLNLDCVVKEHKHPLWNEKIRGSIEEGSVVR